MSSTTASSTSAANTREIPVGKPFVAILAGLALCVVAIGALRLAGYQPASAVPADGVAQARLLHVEDQASGAVVVSDATTGAAIVTYGVGEGSFFRATLRSLVHDRLHKGLGPKGDFRLEAHAGGQLFLIDEATGKILPMNAFGPANAAVFAALMSNPSKGESQ